MNKILQRATDTSLEYGNSQYVFGKKYLPSVKYH